MFAAVLDEEGGPYTLAVDTLDDHALIEQLRHTERARRQLEAVAAATVQALHTRKVFRRDGHHSIYGLVRVVTKRPTREIHDLMRTGALMNQHGDVVDALAEGTLGVAQVHDLAAARAHPRAGEIIAEVVTELVEQAVTLPYPDFKLSVDRAVNLADADGADERAMRRHEGRDAYFHVSANGLHGEIRGGVLAGEALLEILEQYRRIEFDKDWAATQQAHGDQACAARMPRTEAQRRFDAFMNMATASVSTPPGAQPPEPVVNIHGDRTTTATTLARAFGITPVDDPDAVPLLERRCETARGPRSPPSNSSPPCSPGTYAASCATRRRS